MSNSLSYLNITRFTRDNRPAANAWPVGLPVLITDRGIPPGEYMVTDGISWSGYNPNPYQLPTFTYAKLPNPATWPVGLPVVVSDRGINGGTIYFSNGTSWVYSGAERKIGSMILLGDSQVGYSLNPSSASSTTYDPITGLLTINTSGSHGLQPNFYIFFGVRAAPVWNNYLCQVVAVNSSTQYVIQGPIGQSSGPVTADIRYGRVGESFDNGIVSHLLSKSNGSIDIIRIAGITGETIGQIRARINSEVLPLNPGVVFLQALHNDIFVTTPTPFNQGWADFSGAVSDLVNAGIKVIAATVTPTGATYANNTVDKRALVTEYNRNIRKLPTLYPGVAVVDAFNRFVDQTVATYVNSTNGPGQARSGYVFSDLLHWAPNGTALIAQDTVAAYNVWFPVRQKSLTTAFDSRDSTNNPNCTNLIANAGFLTSGGSLNNGITGSVPLNNSVATTSASGSSMVASIQQASWSSFLGNSAKVSWVSPITFNNDVVRYFSSNLSAFVSANQRLKLSMHVKTAGLTGTISAARIIIYINTAAGQVTIGAAHDFVLSGQTYQPSGEIDYYYETDYITLPNAAITNFQYELNFVLIGTTAGNAGIEWGQPDLYLA